MDLIVAVDLDWGIGKDNQLLFSVPEDMRYFRQMTTGKTVVLGRKTLESFPGGRPLPNRHHILLTHGEREADKSVTAVHSLEELEEKIEETEGEIVLIGGASLYSQLYQKCRRAYVTKVFAHGEADSFFPNLDESPQFRLADAGEKQSSKTGLQFQFLRYDNVDF